MLALNRVSHHPIKFGKMGPSTRQRFLQLYRLARGQRGTGHV